MKVQRFQSSEVVSKCSCKKELFEDRFMICVHGKKWLKIVEQKTDLRVDYDRARETYNRVQLRKSTAPQEEK